MIYIFKHIIPRGYVGLTIYPFIFLKREQLRFDEDLINHEKIHLKQQVELLILPFFILYTLEWFIKFIKYQNGFLAYKNLSFEREAYINECNLDYLKNRKRWSSFKYL